MPVQLHRGSALGAISITPLIDVVFLLLIFFLIASQFEAEDRELDILLPTAQDARPMTQRPTEIVINITEQGQYYLGTVAASPAQVQRHLAQAAGNNPLTQSVIVRADRRCAWDFVVQAIDICHRVGIRDIRPTTANETSRTE